MKTSLVLVAVLLAFATASYGAHGRDYWPLDVGYYWIQHSDSEGGNYFPRHKGYYIEGEDSIAGVLNYMMKNEAKTDGDSLLEQPMYVWAAGDSTGVYWSAVAVYPDLDSAYIFTFPVPMIPDSALTQGYTWEYDVDIFDSHFKNVTESTTDTVIVPAGTFTNCLNIWTVETDLGTGDTTSMYHAYYAKDVGEVRRQGCWEEWSQSWDWKLIEYSVGVQESEKTGPPAGLALLQNSPNPFSTVTTIEYSLPSPSDVTVKVYDVLGREVATLASGFTNSGTHSVKWEAKDAVSGIYLYKITADGHSSVKKCIVVK
jgi:hypothetical protein